MLRKTKPMRKLLRSRLRSRPSMRSSTLSTPPRMRSVRNTGRVATTTRCREMRLSILSGCSARKTRSFSRPPWSKREKMLVKLLLRAYLTLIRESLTVVSTWSAISITRGFVTVKSLTMNKLLAKLKKLSRRRPSKRRSTRDTKKARSNSVCLRLIERPQTLSL